MKRLFAALLCFSASLAWSQDYVKVLPKSYEIPGLLQDAVDFNLEEGKIFLWKQLDLLTGLHQLPTQNLAVVKEKKVYKVEDLSLFCHAAKASIFQLEKCQAIDIAILAANRVPVMLEMINNTSDKTHFYALFYKYAIKANPSPLAKGQYGDQEQVYLACNIANDVNVTLHGSKDIVDNMQSTLSADLFDYDGKRRFDDRLRSATLTQGSVTIITFYNRHVIYHKLYVIVPQRITAKDLEEMINAGLGDRDMTYKAPKIKKIF